MTDILYAENDLEKSLNNKISECCRLLEDAKVQLRGKIGGNRLLSKILSENKFLLKLLKTPERIKEEHIRSTNLTHLSSILHCVSHSRNVTEVLKPLTFEDEQSNLVRQVVIDVLADQGKTWIKVVARNPQSVYLSSLGAAGYGKRSLLHQVKDLVNCAKLHPYLYETPVVKVWFAAGVAIQLKKALLKINVDSIGNCVEVEERYVDDFSDETESDEDTTFENKAVQSLNHEDICCENSSFESFNCSQFLGKNKNLLTLSQIPEKSVLNLDVSTMIAYVSSLTNGHCNFIFEDVILSDQAKRERASPVKPILDELFEGRSLICCKLAHHYFQEIINTIGGKNERERAEKLLERVSIVPDDPADKAMALSISSKVKIRTRVIFGTGDNLKAITVTANQGFLRACEGQGVNFVSFLHESRALTELKEPTAKKII